MTRLLGYIGGYLWSFNNDKQDSVQVNVHMYSSARLSIPVGNQKVELEQISNWPWEGKIEFALRNTSETEVTIKLRIPSWANKWQVRYYDLLFVQC
jgi:DUF1680 family protein